ncbi:MAG: phosphotransferase [Bacteroidales bacterium]|nr:phosphotransferase [Bacteroidales bacterium]
MVKETISTEKSLKLMLEGSLDTLTSPKFEEELSVALQDLAGRQLILDATELEYVSSIGLRVLFKLRQKTDYKIINVSPEVYDIFDTVGFDTVIRIDKAPRHIDITGCEVIGRGVNGTVYRLNQDQTAKVYNEKIPLVMIKQERKYAQAAFLSGLPTAISYDTVKCGNEFGIVFEMLNACTFAEKFHDHPENLEKYALIYANVLKHIHSTQADTKILPSAAEKYNGWVDKLDYLYTEEERALMRKMLNALPNRTTTIHGDFHPKNIMLEGEDPLLIDMADVSYGHPLFDFACTTLTHRLYPKLSSETTFFFMGVTAQEITKLWWLLLEHYFETSDRAKLEEIDDYLMKYAILRYALQPAVLPQTPDDMVKATVEYVRKNLFPYINDIADKVLFF